MIKGKLKSVEQLLKEGAKFNENGNLVKKDGGEICSSDFHLLGTIQEKIELESNSDDGNLFEVDHDGNGNSFFYENEFEYLEGFDKKQSHGFNGDDVKVFWHKKESGEIKLVHKDGMMFEKFTKSLSWVDITEEF